MYYVPRLNKCLTYIKTELPTLRKFDQRQLEPFASQSCWLCMKHNEDLKTLKRFVTPLTFEIEFPLITWQYKQANSNTPNIISIKRAVIVLRLFAAKSCICSISHVRNSRNIRNVHGANYCLRMPLVITCVHSLSLRFSSR